MENFVLSCCSTADLSKEHFERRDISYICFHFTLNGVVYEDDLGQTIPFDKFYQALSEGGEASTSQINISEYLAYFSGFLEQGKDILHVSLSSGISGSFSAARSAASIARERYPGRRIYLVDSYGASSGYGLLVDKMADLRDGGMDIDSLYQWVLDHRFEMHYWFFSTDLSFYVKGGRISKAAGLFGGMLGICPLLHMDGAGKLVPVAKIRSKKRVIHEIVDRMEEYASGSTDNSGKCYMSHSACYEDARKVADLVEERFKKMDGTVLINNVGTTIGSHTGPGTVALFFWGSSRAAGK